MNIDQTVLQKQFEELEQKGRLPNDFDCEVESRHVCEIAAGELVVFLSGYDGGSVEALGGGGSAVVISAVFVEFNTRRAIKLPRKRIYSSTNDADAPPVIDPEMHALSKLSHKNITRLYCSCPLINGKGFCYITEYVVGAEPLHTYTETVFSRDDCRGNEHVLSQQLIMLARIIYELTDAIQYMHDITKLLHFDIKPDNLLVSDDGRPYVTDLGYAREFTKYEPEELVKIGFTWKYAHPSLTDPEHGARVTQTPARSKNMIFGKDLSVIFDLYAFGLTLQEVLKKIENIYGPSIDSFYVFNYLHIISCLCLDGENGSLSSHNRLDDFVSDQALAMPIAIFHKHKFTCFTQVKIALERLLGLRRLEIEVPELDPWAPHKINASDTGAITFTPRISAILEHPLVSRLSEELQLGMLDTVYPTASHTRLQHSLGVYYATTQYIVALYYDPDNPTFRILFEDVYAKRLMLAALIHDIGQSTFGHEFEEIEEKVFSHARIGEEILKCDHIKDSKGRSLKAIIEGENYDCWGVKTTDVFRLFKEQYDLPIEGVLHDILDGQLDADKMDFLIRDSVECRVPYGLGMDMGRFLQMLTTAGDDSTGVSILRLAVKQKGGASAEGFALARYQLYQSVYWHHTFRTVKAMLITATRRILGDMQKDAQETLTLFDKDWQLRAYMKHVIGVSNESIPVPGVARGKKKESMTTRIDKLMLVPDNKEIQGKYSNDKTIRFLLKLATQEKDKTLLKDLCERKYYKRIFEAPLSALNVDAWASLREVFRGAKREDLQEVVEKALVRLLRKSIKSKSKIRASLVIDKTLQTFEEIAANKYVFLIDLPTRGWSAGGNDPLFVSDFKRRYFRSDAAGAASFKIGTLWSRHLGDMMRSIAFFRVFCEPELHKLLTRVLSSKEITAALLQAVPQLKDRVR